MVEMMVNKMTSTSSPAPMELPTLGKLPSSIEPSLQGAWSRVGQSSEQTPHFIQQPTLQQSPVKLPTSQVDVFRESTACAPPASLRG